MPEQPYALQQLVIEDSRYSIEAYGFVREALSFAAESAELGDAHQTSKMTEKEREKTRRERHLSGQELCEAIRVFAIKQFGFMAQVVLKQWGVHATSDFGEIVYNMIDAGIMKKSSRDKRSHFDEVYDFEDAFKDAFQIVPHEKHKKSN